MKKAITKICRRCGIEKPVSEFYKKSRQKDGLDYYCKSCVHDYNTSDGRRKAGSERRKRPDVHAYMLEYAKSYNKKYYLENKKRINEDNRARKIRYADKKGEYNSRYRTSPKGKQTERRYATSPIGRNTARRNRAIRRSSGYVSPTEWEKLLASVNGTCPICGKKSKQLHVDHWIPVTRGGKTELGNLIPLCPRCNQTKSDNDPVVFVLERFGESALLNAIFVLENSKTLGGRNA